MDAARLGTLCRAIRIKKRWRQTDLATAVRYGINAFAQSYATDEGREGADAFLGKRLPKWRSRG